MCDTESIENELDYKMESGDYIIQCHIIEGRELRGDPVVTMDIGDTKKHTSIKKDRNNVKWDEVFTFALQNKSKRELDQCKVNISVHDANTFSRNVLIGTFSFDLSDIYFRKHHEYFRHWIAISEDDAMTGYIKLTICVLGRNDAQYIHPTRDIVNDNESIVLCNPAVPRTSYLLTITVFALHDIDSEDPFVSVAYGSSQLHSKKGKHTMDIRCSFEIPVIEPIFTKNITIGVWNHNPLQLSTADPIGTISFNYHEIKHKYNCELPPSYWYLYGAPKYRDILNKINSDLTNDDTERCMNQGMMDGIYCKGRILLQISIRETKIKRRPRVREQVDGLLPHALPLTKRYALRCDLYQGYIGQEANVIETIIKPVYYISIGIGCMQIESKSCVLKGDSLCIQWNEMMDIASVEISQDILQIGDNIHNIPHVFVYLFCKKVCDVSLLAYAKLSLLDLIAGNGALCTPKWIDLKPNPLSNKDIPFPRAVLLCLNDANHADIHTIAPIQPPLSYRMQLRCYIFNAKNICSPDSDPFLEISFCGQTVKTNVFEHSMDPKWFETLIINCDVSMETKPRIYAQLLDDDSWSDASLGCFQIDGEDVLVTYKDEKEPLDFSKCVQPYIKQYPLCDDQGESIGDSYVTACFHLIATEQMHYPMLSSENLQHMIQQQTQQTYIHIITLGLRQLNSPIYIRNPFIRFEIDGKWFGTDPCKLPSPQNPNYAQHIKTQITLPLQCTQFMPNVKLIVKDFLFGGWIQRDIGFTSIELDKAYDLRDMAVDDPQDEEHKYDDAFHGYHHTESANTYKPISKDTERFSVDFEWQNTAQIVHMSELTPLLNTKDEKATNCNAHGAVVYEYTKRSDSQYDIKLQPPEWIRGRDIYHKALEHTAILHTKPFVSFPIQHSNQTVGYFKGHIFLSNSKALPSPHTEAIEKLKQIKDLYLRIYVTKCHRLIGSDINGSCDPYLVLKYGSSQISTRHTHVSNDCNPSFYESFQFEIQMPGTAILEISVMDYDGFRDDLIGKTTIDIEDRYFNRKWQSLRLKPMESRNLYIANCGAPQGKIDIMLDIVDPLDAKQNPLLNIQPSPPIPYELRVIVWNTKDIPVSDSLTNMNDLYVTCVWNDDKQSSDLHLRCVGGSGSFNWRFIWNIDIPSKNFEYDDLCVEIWDKDVFSLNDSLGTIHLTELRDFYHFVYRLNEENRYLNKPLQKVRLNYKGEDRFWVHVDNGKGAVKMSFELIPYPLCETMAAGKGREYPNRFPYLPLPECRVKLSIFNPMRSVRNILGDRLIQKLGCVIGLLACSGLMLFIIPNLIAAITANAITS